MSQPSSVAMHPEAKPSATPTIAIIGMEGSGKTVLAATLAKRFSTANPHGVLIVPIGVKTLSYVERVWGILQGGDWPPSTPPGELFELHWNYRVGDELNCDVRLVDAAGQDLRLLFGAERIHDRAALPSQLRSIAEYCDAADIVMYLVNLRDFLGQAEHETRIANEAALKSAMDCLCQRQDRRVCLVLTQSDLYQDLATQAGGWERLVEKTLTYIFTAHVHPARLMIIPVAAVLDTEVTIDRGDGMPQRVPVVGFHSRGLKTLMSWICTQARNVQKELARKASDPEAAPVRPPASDSSASIPSEAPLPVSRAGESITEGWWATVLRASKSVPVENRRRFLWVGAAGIVLLLWLCGFFTGKLIVVVQSSKPAPTLFGQYWSTHGSVRNNGPAGTVEIQAQHSVNGRPRETQRKEYYLRSGETRNFEFEFWGYRTGDRVEVTVTALAR